MNKKKTIRAMQSILFISIFAIMMIIPQVISIETLSSSNYIDIIDEDFEDGTSSLDKWSYQYVFNNLYPTRCGYIGISNDGYVSDHSVESRVPFDNVKSKYYTSMATSVLLEEESEGYIFRTDIYPLHISDPTEGMVNSQGIIIELYDDMSESFIRIEFEMENRYDLNRSVMICYDKNFNQVEKNISFDKIWHHLEIEWDVIENKYDISFDDELMFDNIIPYETSDPSSIAIYDNYGFLEDTVFVSLTTYAGGYIMDNLIWENIKILFDNILLKADTDYRVFMESKGYVVATEPVSSTISWASGITMVSGMFLVIVAMFKEYSPSRLDWLIPNYFNPIRFNTRVILFIGIGFVFVGFLIFKGVF